MSIFDNKINPTTGIPEEENLDQSMAVNQPKYKSPRISYSGSGSTIMLGGLGDYKKDVGLSYANQLLFPEERDYQRAELQTGPELFGKFALNLVNTAAFEAAKAPGYLWEVGEFIAEGGNAVDGFNNSYLEALDQAKISIHENAGEIYRSKLATEGNLWQKLGEGSFWADQGETIGTSLSLMIPSLGVGALAGGIAKGIGLGVNAAKTASFASAAVFSRGIESAMEANQNYKENLDFYLNDVATKEEFAKQYKPKVDAIDQQLNQLYSNIPNPSAENYRQLEAERQSEIRELEFEREVLGRQFDADLKNFAKNKAGESAAKTFKWNAAMLPLDLMQYGMLMKPFSAVSKAAEDVAKKSLVSKLAENALIQPASEGLEEGYQAVVSSEASESTKLDQDMFGEGFGERFEGYMKEGETQEAILMGALMGGIFEPTGKGIKKVYDKIKPIEKMINAVNEESITEGRYEALVKNSTISQVTDLFKSENFDKESKIRLNELNALKKHAQEDQKLEPQHKESIIRRIDTELEAIDFAKKQDDILKKDDRYKNADVRRKYTQSQLEQFVHKNHSDILNEEIDGITNTSGFSADEVELSKLLSQRANLIGSTNQAISDNELSAEEKTSIKELAKQKQAEYGAKIEELKKNIKAANPKFDKKDLADLSNNINANIKDKQASDLLREAVLNNRVKKYANITKAEAEELAIREEKNNNQALIKSVSSLLDKEEDPVKLNEYKKYETENPEVYSAIKDKLESKLGKIKQSDETKSAINKKTEKKQQIKNTIDLATEEAEIDNISPEAYSGMSMEDFEAITGQAEAKKEQIKETKQQEQPKDENIGKLVDAKSKQNKDVAGTITGIAPSGDYKLLPTGSKLEIVVKKNSIKIKEPVAQEQQAEPTDISNQSEFIVTNEVPLGDPIENTLVNINSDTDLDDPITEENLNKAKSSSEKVAGKNWIHRGPLNYVAMNAAKFKYEGNKVTDEYDVDGKIILNANYDASIAKANKLNQNSIVVLSVNKDDIKNYVLGKGKKVSVENLPISVRNLEDFQSGKTPFMSMPDLSNPKYSDMSETAKKNLMWLRQKMFEAYKKNPNGDIIFYSIVDSKTGSHVVKGQHDRNLGHYLKLPNGSWADFTIVASNKDRRIKLNTEELTLNQNVPPGYPHIVVRNSQGEPVGVPLEFKQPLSSNKDLYDRFVENIFHIIQNHVEEKSGFERGVSSVHEEVDKYIHLKQSIDEDKAKLKAETKEDKTKFNNIFGLQINKDNSYSLFLPGQGNYVQVRIKKVDGKFIPHTYHGKNNFKQESWGWLLNQMGKRLVNMYPNVSSDWGQSPKDFYRWEFDKESGQLVKKQEHYFDYLSDNNLVQTDVHYVLDKEGNHYFTIQPSIAINPNIHTKEEFDKLSGVVAEKQAEVKSESGEKPKPRKIKSAVSKEDLKTGIPDSDIESKPQETDKPLSSAEYDNAFLSSFASMEEIEVENNVMSSLLVELLEKLEEYRVKNIPFNREQVINEVFDEAVEMIETYEYYSGNNINKEEAVDFGVFADGNMNAMAAKYLTHIKNNLEASYNEDGTKAFIGYKDKLDLLYRSVSFKSAYEIGEEEEFDGSITKEQNVDNLNFKTDPEKSLSSQIRRLFSNVRVFNKDGRAEINAIGRYKYEPFEKVFAYLISNLANVPIDEMHQALVELGNQNKIAEEVVKKLSDLRISDPSLFNGFMSAMRKQNAEFITFLINTKDDKAVGKISQTNRVDLKSLLLERWKSSFISTSGFLNSDDSIDKNKAKKLTEDFNKLSLNEGNLVQLSALFNEIGINISAEGLGALKDDFNSNKQLELDGKNKTKRFTSQFSNNKLRAISFDSFIKGNFGSIFTALNNGLNPHDTQTAKIKILSNYQQKFEQDLYNSSYRNGNGDTVYAFVNPHHLSNAVDKLTNPVEFAKFKADPFSSGATWLNNPEQVQLLYFDSSKQERSGASSKDYQDQNPIEKEVTNVNLYLNNGDKEKSYFHTIVHSDKSTFPLIKTNRYSFDRKNFLFKDGELTASEDFLKELYAIFVQPEIERIAKKADLYKKYKDENRLNELVETYEVFNGKLGAAKFFYIFPELNDIVPRNENGAAIINSEIMPKIYEVIRNYFKTEIAYKLESWNAIGLVNNIDNNSFDKNYQQSLGNLATSYVLDNAISFMNQHQLFTGDPAEFAKKSSDDIKNWGAVIDSTVPNLFKRTAKDIAPGSEGLFKDKTYTALYITEPKFTSELSKYNDKYEDISLADAQEWTTLEEHLDVMLAFHKIDQETYDRILANRDNLTYADLRTVLNPMKPVQTMRELSANGGIRTSYIKTSSFPLIPQLTKQFPELDKMRLFMENKNIRRVVPKSAVKVGYVDSVQMFDKDGNFVGDKNIKESSVQILHRTGFKIQQDVPFDEKKDHILLGSQESKQIHQDIEPGWLFNLNDKEVSGVELKNEANAVYRQLYSNAFDKVVKKLKADGLVIKDVSSLKDMMIDEAIDKGYGINEMLMMSTIKDQVGNSRFAIPLFFHPMLHKVEAILNSIIKNKVLKLKFPGKSYVQGSALGFKVADMNFLKKIDATNGVVFTKDFDGSLKYVKSENELYAEILLPSHFKGVDLTQYVKNGFLDTTKIDPQLLTMIGYRIPTSGFSSIIKLKVVGILPDVSGDLVIVPPEITVQMGSDFDVDKLYIHWFNYDIQTNGNLSKTRPFGKLEDMTEQQLQNHLLDLHLSILSNPNIIEKSITPLDDPTIKNLVEEHEGKTKVEGQKTKYKSFISDELHSQMVETQASGKIGVGISSANASFHALAQYAGLYFKPKKTEAGLKWNSVKFSNTNNDVENFNDTKYLNKVADKKNSYKPKDNTCNINVQYDSPAFEGAWRLDKIYGFDGKPISIVLAAIQNESVDNANNGRLYPMNLNRNTFDVAMLIAQTGYSLKTIKYFLNQPIVKEYTKRLNKLNQFTEVDFIKDKKILLQRELLKEIGEKTSLDNIAVENVTIEEMEPVQYVDVINTDLQRRVLKNFIIYQDMAEQMRTIQSILNVDTKFNGKSQMGSIAKRNDYNKKLYNTYIGNVELFDEGTKSGDAFNYGIFKAIKLFGSDNLLPYDSVAISEIMENIANITDSDLTEEDIEKIVNGIRTSVWGNLVRNKYNIDDLNKKRLELLSGENSLAKRVLEAQKNPKFKKDYFIQSLVTIVNKKHESSFVEHISSKSSKENVDMKKQLAWLKLLKAPVGSYEYNLGHDLAIYSILFGMDRNARDFGRFIPYDYIINENFAEQLRDVDFNSGEYSQMLLDNYLTQYFQHNPGKLQTIKLDNIVGGVAYPVIKLNPDFLEMNGTPEFVKFYVNKSMVVYKLIGENYYKLDKLGDSFRTEYSLLDNVGKTSIYGNPRGGENIPQIAIRTTEPKIKEPNAGIQIFDQYNFNGGVDAVLESISKSNSRFSQLARYLMANTSGVYKYDLQEFDIDNPYHRNVESSYYNVSARLIHKHKIIAMNPGKINNNDEFEAYFIHEAIHAGALELINTPDERLNAEQLEAKKSILKLYEDFKAKFPQANYRKEFSNAFKNIDEFIAEVMENKGLQELLNNTPYEKKNFLQKLMDFIQKLFVGVKKGSMLEAAFHDILNVIEMQETMTKDQLSEEFFTEIDKQEADKIMRYCLEFEAKLKSGNIAPRYGR